MESIFSLNVFLWLLLSGAITGVLSILIKIEDSGPKTGFICSVAFFLGIMSTHIKFF